MKKVLSAVGGILAGILCVALLIGVGVFGYIALDEMITEKEVTTYVTVQFTDGETFHYLNGERLES